MVVCSILQFDKDYTGLIFNICNAFTLLYTDLDSLPLSSILLMLLIMELPSCAIVAVSFWMMQLDKSFPSIIP